MIYLGDIYVNSSKLPENLALKQSPTWLLPGGTSVYIWCLQVGFYGANFKPEVTCPRWQVKLWLKSRHVVCTLLQLFLEAGSMHKNP